MNRKFYHAAGRTVLVLALAANVMTASAEIRREAKPNKIPIPPLFGVIMEDTDDGRKQAKGIFRVPRNADEEPLLIVGGLEKCVGADLMYSGVYVNGTYYLSYGERGEVGASHTSVCYPMDYSGLYAVNLRSCNVSHSNGPFDRGYFSCCTSMAYDGTTGYVYGSGCDGESWEYNSFRKIQFSTYGASTEIIADHVSCYNLGVGADGQLYQLDRQLPDDGERVTIYSTNKNTGRRVVLGKRYIGKGSITSACIDKANNRYLLNFVSDGNSYIYSFNLETLECRRLYQLSGNVSFHTLFVADDLFPDDAPAECVVAEDNTAISIAAGSLTGRVSLTAPSYTWSGTPGAGPLRVSVMGNNTIVGTAEAEWGKQLEIDLAFTKPGWYNIKAYASNEAGKGMPVTVERRVFIGCDTPVAPKPYLTYAGGNLIVKWPPVTDGTEGGFMDLNDIRYSVWTGQGDIVEQDIANCSLTVENNLSDISKDYQYKVCACYGSRMSKSGISNIVGPYCFETPYEPDFNASDTRKSWEYMDLNKDGHFWYISSGRLQYNPGNISPDQVWYCNEWAITPAIYLRKGMKYIFSCDVEYKYGVPRLDVNLCEAPTPNANIANLTTYMPQVTQPNATGSEHLSKSFTANEDGYYYLGFELTGSVSYLGISNLKLIADPSGIDTAEADTEAVRAWGAEGTICIDSAEGLGVTIVGIDGSVVFSGQGSSAMRIPAVPGIYIVKAGRTARKLTVR